MWLLPKLFTPNKSLPTQSSEPNVSRESKLIEITQFLKEHNITTFITQGTCLGLVRAGELIEYDHDIDIAFYEWDANRLKTLVPDLNKRGFFIEEVTNSNLRLQIDGCIATMDLWILHKPNFFYRLLGFKWWVNNGLFRTDYFNVSNRISFNALGIPFIFQPQLKLI